MAKSNEHCCVFNCPSIRKKRPFLMYHTFPTEGQNIEFQNPFGHVQTIDRKELWILKLRLKRVISKSMKVCSEHFVDEDYECSGWASRKRLKNTAVPSQKLPFACPTADNDNLQKDRKNRDNKIRNKSQHIAGNNVKHLCKLINSTKIQRKKALALESSPRIVKDVGTQVDLSDLLMYINPAFQVNTPSVRVIKTFVKKEQRLLSSLAGDDLLSLLDSLLAINFYNSQSSER